MSSSEMDVALACAAGVEIYLQDERLPHERLCAICYLGFLPLLGGNAPVIPILQTQRHGFLDTCMRNISIPLTAREEQTLCRRLQDCIDYCDRPGRRRHLDSLRHHDHSHIDDPRELLRSLLSQAVHLCLYGFDGSVDSARSPVGRAFDGRKRFRAANGAWPTSVDQLFPHGEESTVDALIDSCCSFASCNPLLLLRAVLDLARPRIWDILVQQDNQHRIVWAITTTILLGVPDGYLSLDPGSTPYGCSIPQRWGSAQWLRNGKGIHACAAFLNTIVNGNYARPDDAVRFTARHAQRVRDVFRLALHHYRATQPSVCQTLKYYLTSLDRRAKAQVHREDDDLIQAVETAPRSTGVLRIIRFALRHLPDEKRCSSSACARTMLDRADEADKPLSICARCTLARYCTRRCQQDDWKAGHPVPHKKLCPVLSSLRDAVDIGLLEKEYLLALRQSSIPDEDLAMAGRWALSKGLTVRDRLRVEIMSNSPVPLPDPTAS